MRGDSVEETASTLVLYDWQGQLNRQLWLQICFNFFKLVDAVPNYAQYGISDGSFHKAKPKGLAQVFEKKRVGACDVERLLPPFVDVTHSDVSVAFAEPEGERKRLALFSHRSKHVDVELFVGVVQAFAEIAQITYGHAYLRPARLGPTMYAYDLNCGLEQSRPEDRVALDEMMRWRAERLDLTAQQKPASFRHLVGMQRDVYPFNVLTLPHLRYNVEGKPFGEWVASAGGRGNLHLVTKDVWVWVVPEVDLGDVRERMSASGALVSK